VGRAIGIDLGTTNCCVATLDGGQTTVLQTRHGQRTMPSVVAFGGDRGTLVGSVAQRQAVTNPHRTIFGVKRLVGRKVDDPLLEEWKRTVPYEVIAAPNGDAWVRTRDSDYSPQEVQAIVLEELKQAAEEALGEEVTDAIITVPAYFSDTQRQATKDAGKIAGLNVKGILNEPTAAALGYGVHKDRDQTLAIVDLGGGTFDVTVMRTSGGVFEVLATSGDTFLGGDDFDRLLIEHLIERFEREHDVQVHDDSAALQRLKEAAETAKRELSTAPSTAINLPFIATGPSGPLHINIEALERGVLEGLSGALIDRLEAPCAQALEDAGISHEELDQVLLVGGMTRMPMVQRKVEEIFGNKIAKDVNPDEIVAVGAAIQSGILAGEIEDVVLLDVTPHSLGVRVKGDRMSKVIPRNTTIPTSEAKRFATTEDDQTFVEVQVYQGEGEKVSDNTPLGRFTLGDLPARGKGEVQVEVNFLVNADGVLEVTAHELTSGKQASVRIDASGGLTKNEVRELRERHNTGG
jgi:molecular chaperone DnaK